jgi:shikimate kinase/3-dehydroquinate synthase
MTTDCRVPNIVLTGFMATGKSSVGKALAASLGREFVDVDTLIEADAGKSVPDVFRAEGEAAFRRLESRAIARLQGRRGAVIAAGGGAVLNSQNLLTFLTDGLVVTLTADPETILARLGDGQDRPMLWGGDSLDRIRRLLAEREPAYAKADRQVETAGRSVEQVVAEITAWLEGLGVEALPPPVERVAVGLQPGYEILAGDGLLPHVGRYVRPLRFGRRLAVVTHPELAGPLGYAAAVVESLRREGHDPVVLTVPPGEDSKSLERVGVLVRAMVDAGLDRAGGVLALGGGVVGDLAGVVAAILFRGVPFVNLPTTLLSQVDSSVGGKTGVNLPEGKNLVGAFYQPRLVVADVRTLATLPEREFASGLAEVVKHAMIADAGLFRYLEEHVEHIRAREPEVLRTVVARNCAIKAAVVEEDERETGRRMVLNFGHTVGHAIEAALAYGTVTHGEAVARGMAVAAALSVRRGLCPPEAAARLTVLLRRFGLLTAPPPPLPVLEKYLLTDKKRRDGRLQFVLASRVGNAILSPIANPDELQAALDDVSRLGTPEPPDRSGPDKP